MMSAKRTVPVHNLRPNDTTWTPAAIATFDTETSWETREATEVHRLRCWAAQLTVRRGQYRSVLPGSSGNGTLGADLAVTLAGWARTCESVWVYAHNLGFDLAVSQVVQHLGELGWHVTEFAIDAASPFVRMSDGRHRLILADSFSWLPVKLEEAAASMGTCKLPLPAPDAPAGEWIARCDRDAGILMDAMCQLMDWWDKRDLGRWSVTGSASGWNVMRHLIDARRFTIQPDKPGIEADRAAVYGGRRGQWRHGQQPPGRYGELDFASAYPQVASSLPLPLERMASFTSLPAGHAWITSERHGIIAEVTLRAREPRWPVRHGRRVWYPVGTFTTVLAGPDIAEAAHLGMLMSIGPGHVHRLGYALKPWADWTLNVTAGGDYSAPGVAIPWAKHCGRATIGKWAQRGFETVEIGPAPTTGWDVCEGWHHTQDVRALIVDFDGRRFQVSASGYGDNCYPAVLAWVESYVRVRLGRLIDSLPTWTLVCADTDGVIVDMAALGEWEADSSMLAPLEVRLKHEWSQVDVTGPQHVRLDDQRRYAGVPAGARPNDDGSLSALLWPKLYWQMSHGRPGTYTRPVQHYVMASSYAPGWVLDNGDVVPPEMSIDGSGHNRMLPFNETRWAGAGMTLGASQNETLGRSCGTIG